MFETGSSRRWRVSRTALVLAQALFLSVSLLGPAYVSAADPSADPSATPAPSAEPTAEPTADPSAAPSAEPTPDPTPAPTSNPTPAPSPDPTAAPTTDPTTAPATASVPYIVTFATGVDGAAQTAILAGAGAVETGSIPVLRMRSILVTPSSAADVIAALRADPQVFRVDADRVREAEAAPNDTSYGEQWSLAKIGWDQVYGTVTPSGSAVVAVLDTGVDASHPDLAGQLVAGTSVLDGSAGTSDPNGHGTAMAGIIAARTDNATGIAGIGYAGVKVMPVTVLDSNGHGQDSDIIAGVVWAVDHGADVINMSFSNPGYSASLQAAIDYAWAHNVVVVAATGNDGSSTVTFPAGDRGVIGVSNTDQTDALNPSSNHGQDVFLAAPGTDIVSSAPGGGSSSITGTSASSAEVAGAAALLRAVDPSASNGVIVGRLARTADAAGTVEETGNGRLNLERALGDSGAESVVPAGSAPLGSGGPIIGPYVAATRNQTAIISPTSATVGTAVTYTITVTNTSTSGEVLGCVHVTVPVGAGTPSSLSVVATDPGSVARTWTSPTVTSGVIETLGTGAAANDIDPTTGTVAITFTTTATTAGSKEWTTESFGQRNCNGQKFNDPSPQPVVTVGAATPASLTVTKTAVGGNDTFGYTTNGSGLSPFSIVTSGGTGSHGPDPFTSAQFGDKYVTETPLPAGWDLTGISCTTNGATVAIGTGQGGAFNQNATAGFDVGDNTVKVTVAAGNTPSCAFTDTKRASLTVTKTAVGGNDTFGYTTNGSGLSPFSIVTSGGTGSHGPDPFTSAQFGDKYVTETPLPAGWDLTGISCTTNGATVAIGTGQGGAFNQNATAGFDVGDNTVKVTVAAGNTPSCAFTNTKRASLTVTKILPNNDGGTASCDDFVFQVNGGPDVAFEADCSNDIVVVAGIYTVTETARAGYTASYSSCSGLVLPPGGSATCTISNDDIAPTLKLVKSVTNDDGGDAVADDWTLTAQAATPFDDRNVSTPGGSGVFETVYANQAYSLAETGPGGYTAGSWSCTGGSLVGSVLTLAEGATGITCTISNDDIAPTLKLVKSVTNDDGGDAVADDWTLTAQAATPFDDRNVSTPGGSGVFETVYANQAYSLAETGPGGYTAGSWSCTGGSLVGSVLTLAEGATGITCTISNDDIAPTLKLVKSVTNDDGGDAVADDWTLTAQAATPFDDRNVSTPGGSGVFETVYANQAYSLAETGPGGYTAGSWSCTGGSLVGSVLTLAEGATGITCTISNDDIAPTLKLVKSVTNDDGGDAVADDWTLTAQAATPFDDRNVSTPGGSGVFETVYANQAYSLAETGPGGYAAGSWSCTGGSLVGSVLTLAEGATGITCTISNDDQPVTLTVIKHVINDNGGPQLASAWTMSVSGSNVQPASSFPGAESPGTTVTIDANAAYSVSESGPSGYARSDSVDCASLTGLPPGSSVTCTITNDDIQPKITVTKVLVPANDPGRFNLRIAGTSYATNVGNGGSTGAIGINAGTITVDEMGGTSPVTSLANYTTTIDCGSGPVAGSSTTVTLAVGQNKTCVITNTINDADGDLIPDFLDCSSLYENRVVDPSGTLAAYLPLSRRHATLQAAVTAGADNDVISMYANTTENVIIGSTTGSGGKDLRIVGCGHKITAAVATNPVITIQSSAGANDGNTGAGEADIHVDDLDVLKGSIGYLIQTSKPSPTNTSTLLKSIRSDQNGPGNGTGTATVGNPGIGIKLEGNGNKVRGANSVGTNAGDGINVTGNTNVLESNRVTMNKGDGIDVAGNANNLNANKVGDKSLGNKGDGIKVAGDSNVLEENDAYGNTTLGIRVTGNLNQVFKNDVGDKDKGNMAGGILITGNGNLMGKDLSENDVFANGGVGIAVVGNTNQIKKNDVGDGGKGNTGDGINVQGYGNVIDENNLFANGGDGIETSGGTAAQPNLITSNDVGDRGKGNLGNGIVVGAMADTGNGILAPIEISENKVIANKLNGIWVKTAGHQLANSASGGSGAYPGGSDNGDYEFLVVAGNFNAGGNTYNGTTVPGAINSAFPTAGQGTP